MHNYEKIYLFCFPHWESSSQWHYFYDYIKSCRNGHYLLRNKYNITWSQMQNSENINLFCFPHWESVSVTRYLWWPEKTRTTTRRAGKNNNQPTNTKSLHWSLGTGYFASNINCPPDDYSWWLECALPVFWETTFTGFSGARSGKGKVNKESVHTGKIISFVITFLKRVLPSYLEPFVITLLKRVLLSHLELHVWTLKANV